MPAYSGARREKDSGWLPLCSGERLVAWIWWILGKHIDVETPGVQLETECCRVRTNSKTGIRH